MKVIQFRHPYSLRASLVVLCCVVILLLQPARQLWMSLFFPRPWARADAVHLYKVLTDYQNIRLDRAPLRKIQGFTEVTDSSRPEDPEHLYPEFWRAYKTSSPGGEQQTQVSEKELITMFQPLLNRTERHLLMSAFRVFHSAVTQAGLTYFITEASLMGVIRHHGMIPWDDDIDVAMSVKDWVRIRDVLSNIAGFELFPQAERHWKFYSTRGRHFETEYHAFPYIDIFFYDEDDSYLWAVSYYLKHDLVFHKEAVFPLQLRPFEGMMVPTPCDLDTVVRAMHDSGTCVTPAFVHKTNAGNTNDHIKVDCRRLQHLYPFVQLGARKGALQEERLMVGDRMVHAKWVPQGCKGTNMSQQ